VKEAGATAALPAELRNLELVCSPLITIPDNFTIFEGTSEIRRLIIGRAPTGLGVR
jgi:hypothetical protein